MAILYRFKVYFFFCCLLAYHQYGIAQQSVDVDLGGGVFTSTKGLPFDVPFIINGKALPSLRKVIVKYTVKSGYKSRKWFHVPNTDEKTWYQTGEDKWHIQIGPLNPNTQYTFSFKTIMVNDIKPTDREQFKISAYDVISRLFADPATIDAAKIKAANDELNKKLALLIAPGQKFQTADDNDYAIKLGEEPYATMTKEIQNIALADIHADNSFQSLQHVLSNTDYLSFKTKLNTIASDPTVLNPASSQLWNEPVDPGLDAFKSVKTREVALMLVQHSDKLLDLLEGKRTIMNGDFITSATPNLDAINLILSFFNKIAPNLTDVSNHPVFNAAQISVVPVMIQFIPDVTAIVEDNTNQAEHKKAFLAAFPDVIANLFVSTTYIITDQPSIDVVSQNSPYIGLDFGLSYIPGYSQLFAYEGVNFYFVPVNKDAPLTTFKGWNNIIKRLSVHLGLTQSLIDVPDKRYIALTSAGSILFGGGLRINRIMRLNAGYMFFYEKDNNPLLDKKHFTAIPEFSFTVDINIARALGGLGKRLGVSQ